MNFGSIIIGDEILSGKRRDSHFQHTIEALGQRGLELKWCRIVGDDSTLIIDTLRQTLATDDIVFCFGGIGATPDDLTRQCAATAAALPLVRHPGAVAEIEAQFGAEAYPRRVLMADLPEGCGLIPNPFNRIPGFTVGRHHFLPGFPQMAWPMMVWVLDHLYPDMRNLAPETEEIITVFDVMESPLLDMMNGFVARFPEVRFSSLPHIGEDNSRAVELGVKGARPQVAAAMDFLKREVSALGYRWADKTTG